VCVCVYIYVCECVLDVYIIICKCYNVWLRILWRKININLPSKKNLESNSSLSTAYLIKRVKLKSSTNLIVFCLVEFEHEV
jgi:hypothetical protein